MPLPLVNLHRNILLPTDFKFGVADADLQVVGDGQALAEEGSEPTIWRTFTEKNGLATPGEGVDRYHLWPADIELIERLGVRHYRTSVSMSRTLTRHGEANERAIEWYKRYFGALKEKGIAIYATLYHWELPHYLSELGGWTNRATTSMFERHAQVVAEYLGEFIDEYFIMDEPWCSSMLSYYEGVHAPGKQHASDKENMKAALLAAHHLLVGQALAYTSIKERDSDALISTVLNFEPAYAASPAPEDVEAAKIRDGYYNRWFLDPIFTGRYPEQMVRLYGEDAMPPDYEKDMDLIKIGEKLNALGVNYYRGSLYRAGGGYLRSEQALVEGAPVTGLGWPIYEPPYYPEGLYDLLQQVYFGYRAFGLKKLYITENGMALLSPWDGQTQVIDDEQRIRYYAEHMRQLEKALVRGIPIEGYFAWTLMDNFEWAEGYRPESAFGLIHVDRATMKRVWKKSGVWYSELVRTHDLSKANDAVDGV